MRQLDERYWAKVATGNNEECWPWTAAQADGRGGRFSVTNEHGKKQSVLAHRYGWKIANGRVPDGHLVHHKCGNNLCQNPSHMISAPRGNKGRWPERTFEERFWDNVARLGPDDCWEWTGTRQPNGYGVTNVRLDGRWIIKRTHRLSWELAHGEPPPPELHVCHACDNPPCVNPAHLWLGTDEDNLRDMTAKGRRRGPSKLVPDDVRDIRQRAANGEPQASIARSYDINQGHISAIVNRKRWQSLE